MIHAAAQAFWERGYEATGLDELERATGLSRSSIYLAFGTKRGLFDVALQEYKDSFIATMLAPLEAPSAGPQDAATFFRALAELFRGELGSQGCLMVNTILELGGRDAAFTDDGALFFNRFRRAFTNVLDGTAPRSLVARRADVLSIGAMGAWATSRVDPAAAAAASDAVAAEIRSWRRPAPPVAPRPLKRTRRP